MIRIKLVYLKSGTPLEKNCYGTPEQFWCNLVFTFLGSAPDVVWMNMRLHLFPPNPAFLRRNHHRLRDGSTILLHTRFPSHIFLEKYL